MTPDPITGKRAAAYHAEQLERSIGDVLDRFTNGSLLDRLDRDEAIAALKQICRGEQVHAVEEYILNRDPEQKNPIRPKQPMPFRKGWQAPLRP